VSLSIENTDQAVELEWDHQEARKEFLESADSGNQTSSEVGGILWIPFQHAIAVGIDDSMAVVVDRNVVEEREKVEDGLERVGGECTRLEVEGL
jgi:hypothetical protein